MKRFAILMLTSALLSAELAAQSFLADGVECRDLETGAVLSPEEAEKAPGLYGEFKAQLFDSPQSVSFVRVSPEAYALDILCGVGHEADSTSAFCIRAGAIAGINGSYFNMRSLSHATFVLDDGELVSITAKTEAFRTNGVFSSRPGGVTIDAINATSVSPREAGFREALASGPILLDEGMVITYARGIHDWKRFYARRHPRSLIGTDADGFIWLVVVDGRAPEDAEGMTIAELTALARMMGLTDALNLDGGGSSTLWTVTSGVLNHPCDNRRFDHAGQRIVPNVISVKKRESK